MTTKLKILLLLLSILTVISVVVFFSGSETTKIEADRTIVADSEPVKNSLLPNESLKEQEEIIEQNVFKTQDSKVETSRKIISETEVPSIEDDLLISVDIDVEPIFITESEELDYEEPIVDSDDIVKIPENKLIQDSFILEPEELQPFSDELLRIILEGIPEIILEDSILTLVPEDIEPDTKEVVLEKPPAIMIIDPDSDIYYRSKVTVNFKIFNELNDSEFDRITRIFWISSDGEEFDIPVSDSNEYSFSLSTIGYNGPLSIKVVVQKDNGLIDEQLVLLEEDIKGPSITILSPDENSVIENKITISGSLFPETDDHVSLDEINSFYYQIANDDHKYIVNFDENGVFQVEIDNSDLDGLSIIKFTATDKNLHKSTYNFPFISGETFTSGDLVVPVIIITNPDNNSLYNSKIIVTGEVLNELNSKSSDQIKDFYWTMAGDDQKNYIDFSSDGVFNFQISTVDMNRNLSIIFTAVNNSAVKKDILLNLTNDQKGPEITLHSPENNQYFSKNIQVTGQVRDVVKNQSEVKSLYWSVSSNPGKENLIFFEDDGSFDFQINTADINGLVNFQLNAYDLNNNRSTYSVELNDGKKSPVIQMETPEIGAKYGAGILVKGKISDPYSWNNEFGGIESISAQIEPADVVSEGEIFEVSIPVNPNGVFEYIFRTDKRTGEQNINIKVLAKNGNSAVNTVQINQGEFPISDFVIKPGDQQLNLTWTTLPFISNYFVNYTTDGTKPTTESILSLNDVKPPLVLSDLTNGSLYSFVLTGNTEEGTVQSDIIRSLPMADDTLDPSAKGEFGYIDISWLPIKGVNSFRVLRSEDDFVYKDISGEIIDTRYIDRSAIFGTEYFYKIIPSEFSLIESSAVKANLLSEPPQRLTQQGSLKLLKPDTIEISGDYAYVASKDEGFYIVDISDPSNLSIRGSLQIFGAEDLTVSGDYVFIAAGDNGFFVVNISEPASPRVIGSRKTTDARSVFVDKEYIYIADGIKGIKIFSLDDPKRPPRVFGDDSQEAYDVTVSGDKLYVSSGSQGLNIWNVSDPEIPSLISTYEGLNIIDSEVKGNYCYSASGETGLYILDISDPLEPFICSSYKTINAQSIILSGNHAMVADGEGGLLDIDVTDPYRPESFESLKLSFSSSVDASENIVLVADRSGLFSVKSFQHGQSFKVGEYQTEGDANSVTIKGNKLYISDHSEGVVVLEMTNPNSINDSTIIYNLESDYAEHIVIEENLLYLADGAGGIKIYKQDVNGKFVLNEIIEIEGTAKKIDLSDKYILSAAGTGGIQGKKRIPDGEQRPEINPDDIPLDAVDDKVTKYLADITIPFSDVRDIVFFDEYLFVADRKRGLIVVDFTNPDSPVTIFEKKLPGAVSIEQNENRIYVVHSDGINIFDVRNKDNPVELTLIETSYAEDIKVNGTILYVAEGHAGLSVYDVKDPDKILKLSVCEDIFADSVTIDGDYAYIADSTGINVVRIYIPQWIKR